MTASLGGAFADLDRYTGRIPLAALHRWLCETELDLADLERFARFHPERYQRNLAHSGPAYQALVLCWRNGQRSPIHDHSGSSCAVKVMLGAATETVFEHAPNGMVYPTTSRRLEAGFTCASQDADIHQISNLQGDDANLVTLHVYSPPLMTMNMYSLTDGAVQNFFDPVNEEFVGGAGI